MKFRLYGLALAVIAVLATACEQRVQPIYNPTNVPIPQSLAFTSLEEIGEGIKRAGASQNWQMTDKGAGEIEAVLKIRTHKANVRIDYSQISYSITYVSSINLLENGAGIHRNYNTWVRQLESAINVNLQKLATTTKNEQLTTGDKAMMEAWKQAENTNDPLVLQDFMDRYGDGPYAAAAQQRLNELAQLRTSGVKRFDPTGTWRVVATYKANTGNTSWCGRDNTWVFLLDFRKGRFSRTYWSGRAGLYVTGENADDFVNLKFDYPEGGHQWKWTERFKLDSGDERLTATSTTGGTPPGCSGTIGVHMVKQ